MVSAATEVSGSDPLALPPLNDRIDPDYLDTLLSESPTPGDGVRVAVEVSFDDVSVLLRDDGCVAVYSDGEEPNQLDRLITVDHDWSTADSLLSTIGEAVATASEDRPTDLRDRLFERLDSDVVDRLLRPDITGIERSDSRLLLSIDGYEVVIDPDGSVAVEPSLAVHKRSGAAFLLVGSVPERGFDRATATLLGDPDEPRSPMFVLHGRNRETATRRLSMTGISPTASTVIEHHAPARAASTASADVPDSTDRGPDVVPVSGGTRDLLETARGTIEDATFHSPGELRLSVDSLGSMIDSSGLETTRDAVESVCRTVREQRGLGCFLLPGSPDDERVERLTPLFDAVIELRTEGDGVNQRWRLVGTGHETSWFPL